jgi:hypothetical protein
VLGLLAGHDVETFMGYRDAAVAEPAKQFTDLRRTLPDEDRLRSL